MRTTGLWLTVALAWTWPGGCVQYHHPGCPDADGDGYAAADCGDPTAWSCQAVRVDLRPGATAYPRACVRWE